MSTEIELIKESYLALLQIPPATLLRIKCQSTLVALRDYIAVHEDREPEDVQNAYEQAVLRELTVRNKFPPQDVAKEEDNDIG